jgi:hypothetical protein
MTSNVTNRSVVRKEYAALLSSFLVGTGKPVKVVYPYQVGDFKGESPVIVVTSVGTGRASPIVAGTTTFYLETHVFILYAAKPVIAGNEPDAGIDVVIELVDTSIYAIGNTVAIEDETNLDIAVITDIDPDISITVDLLAHSFANPRVYIWTESQSEDLLDYLEKAIADIIVEANTTSDVWVEIENDDRSEIDVVEIGGDAYRHEIIPVRIDIQDFET